MKNLPSKRSQINTELALRAANRRIKQSIEAHSPTKEHANIKIDFYCECSDPICPARVSLKLAEFEKLHDEQSQFVIAKGHVSPSIEKVVKTGRQLQVVQKYAL